MKLKKTVCAVVLAVCLLAGLTACGTHAAGYLTEVQRVSEWTCYETESAVELSFSAAEGADVGLRSAQAELGLQAQLDRADREASLSGGLSADFEGIDLYGAQTDLQTRYDLDTVYFQDGILFVPAKLVRDIAGLDGIYYEGLSALDAIEQDYIAIDIGQDAGAVLPGMPEGAVFTADQAQALGELLQDYATDLDFDKNGRSYTLSGELKQLPAELLHLCRFALSNSEALNEILALGMDGETLASLFEMAHELDAAQAGIGEAEQFLREQGISGEFSITVTFADGKVTERLLVTLNARDYGSLSVRIDTALKQLAALELDVPSATEPMTPTELDNLMNGWTEEGTAVSAWIDLETGWMSTTYWDGTPVYDYAECPLYMQNGEYLFGFRALMEGMGFSVDYDQKTDTVYLIDGEGARTAVSLYEQDGRSYITADQLAELGFTTEIDTEWLTASIEYQPGV